MANKPVFRKISTAAEAQKNNNSNSHNSSKEERADVARSSDKPVFKKVRTAWGGDVSSIQTPSQKSPSSTRQQWVATGGGRKSTSPTAGVTATQQGSSNRYIAAENKKKLEQLQNQRRQAAMDLDTDTVNRLDREIKTLQTNPGTLERVAKTVTGGAKSSGAAYTNTLGYVQEGTRNARDVDINSWERELSRAQYEIQNADNDADRIYWQLEASKMQDNIRNAQKMTERSTTAAQSNYRRADELAANAAEDLDRAKEGAGYVGRMLVDAGASMTQSTLDAIPNLLTGGAAGMVPFAIRAFGGAAQQARQSGATWGQQGLYGAASAAKEVFTEKMFNIALPFAKAYGGGALDDVVARGIRSAVDKFAKTSAGKNALGAMMTFGAGALGEGLEEFIGDWMEWQLPRIYGGDVATAQETLSNSLYDFLVGATSGAMGGVVSPNTYLYDMETIQTGQQADVVDPRVQQIMNTMNAQEQRTAGEAQTVGRSPSAQRETARQAESARPAVPAEVQTILQQEAAVRRSFTGVQDTLGESGRKAFQDAYRQGKDRGNYTGEFLRAYHAGMTGQKNPNGTSDVSFAAYTAGKNDAAASLAREKRAAQFAGTAGTDSGLVFDHYVENRMDSAVADEVNAVAKALGVRVQMVDQVLGGQGNGQISGSDILIAKNANSPVLQVVGHEWTHRVQELAPDTYRSFRDAVGSMPDVQDAVQILVKQYNEAGIETSYEQALDEATANYAGEMIENSNVLDDFIRKHSGNRTLLQKLKDAIHEIVGKLTGRTKRQAQTVEGKLQAAFEAASKQAESLNNKNTATEGGEAQTANGIRYSAKMSFEDQVDAVLDRELDRNSSVYVMDTPEMLQSLGLKDYPMLMTQRHILDIVHEKSSKNTHWHGLSSDMVKQLPGMIENPVMILESVTKSGDAVIITSELDGDGLPVVVSVHPDGSGQYNRAEIASNFITSMYGKDGFEGFIFSAVNDGRVLYNNKKRTRTLFANAGLQLPGSLLRDGFFKDNVSQNGENVKSRYSLKSVPAVQPKSDDWRPGATFAEVKEAHPTLFALDADEADTRNPTQITGTVKSYRKIYDALKTEGFDGTILDASSGLGYGTRAGRAEYGFDVDDIEPFPDSKYQPNYTDYSSLDKTYDVIISNAVLNVMPQDLRDAMVVKIGEMLNPGGRAFINVRGTDVKNAGSKVAINDDLMEYFISNTGSYQKGFTSKELVSYLKDALGDGFTVEPTRKFGAVSAIVTRDVDGGKPRYSLKDYSDVEKRDHRKKAIAFFGKTYNWNETGYLTPAGTKLDFSGRHEGGPGGYRTVDHRDIRDAISEDYGGDDYSGSMVQFMSEGNIRISPESGGINLSVAPTKSQLDALSDFIGKNRGEVILDLDTPDGQTVSSTEYPRGTHSSKVLNDIKAYFKDGTTPRVSEVSQFLSLKGTENARELAALKRENESLKERVEYWKGQTRRSQGVTTDQKSVRKAADALVKDYGAEISGSEIAGDLQNLYDYIASGKDGKDELTYTEARRRSDAIAEKIAESAVAVDDQTYQEYAELRKYLRDTKLTLSSEDAANIADYADFRKEQFGKLKIGKGERTNVDQIYAELSNQYPEFFNEQRETNVSDQLQRIADVAGQLYTVTEYNPFEGYMGQAVASISNDIMDRFFDLPQTKKTFADRAAEQVQEAKRAGRQAANDAFLAGQMAQGRKDAKRLRSTAEALAKERTRRAEQVQALQERYREKNAARRESQQNRELRAKITRHANALSKKLVSPTDAQHIPENMRTAVARVLDSINQESAYTLDANGKRVYDGSGTPTKRTEAFQNLKEQYQKIAAEGDMVIDPSLFGVDNKADGQEVGGKFDEVIHMGETRLADLTNAQLKTMWNVLKTVEHSVKTAGKTLSSEKYSTTKQFANSLMDGLRTRRNKTGSNTSISLETPYTFFSHFGQTGMDIYRMLRNAQDRQELMSRNVAEKVQNILDGKEEGHGLVGKLEEFRGNNVWKLNTDTRQFTTTEGKKLTLTPAQAMEIYLLSKREQAQAHLMTGGIVQPEILSAATGKPRIERGTETIRLSEKDLQAISNSLTAEQVRMADALQKLTTGILADYGNEASMKAYGYKKFTEEHYWPIRTAKEARHSSVEKSSDNVRAIKNIGMAQALTPKASAALDISGVFDTFSRHASDMIDYAAWLCPMEDANRLFNFKYQDENGNPTDQNVKFLLDEKGGKGSQEYWTKLMNDIQNGIGGRGFEPLTNWFAKQVGRFKAAAVGANWRVVVQQPTAFFRASIVLSRADMARGLAGGVTKGDGWKKALKYSPIAMRKDVGSFDISSPYTLSDRFYGQSGFATKINDKAGSLAGKADALTWGALWNACEWQVKREKPNLRPGSNEFYSEVNKVFTDMIDQTQVVDGILQRSNIMRSNNDLAQQATAFMGEPVMSLNVFMRSYDEFKYEQDPVKRGKALKKMGRTVTSLVETAVVNAAVQSLIDGIRDDDRDKDYWERVLEAFTGITGDEENWVQYLSSLVLKGNVGQNLNPAGQIPFIKDIVSKIQGYDVTRPDMETFSDLVDATKTFIDSAGGTGKKTRKEALIGLLAAAAKMVGLPLSNVKRDSMAMLRTIALQSGNIPFQYEIEKFTYNIGSEKNKSRYMALLYDALEQGDYTSFEHIREDLMANMPDIDGAKIDSSMASLYKKKLDKNPDYTLPKKAMDYIGIHGGYAEEEQEDAFDAGDLDAAAYSKYSDQRAETYRSAEDTINASSAFRSADNETRNRALKNVESFAEATALADASDGKYKISENSWILKAREAQKKYGIDPGTFSLLRAQVSNLEGLKDKDGETIKNSKGYQIMQLVYTNIRDERQRKAMFEYLGVSKSIQHMNKAAVEEKLRNMRKKAK